MRRDNGPRPSGELGAPSSCPGSVTAATSNELAWGQKSSSTHCRKIPLKESIADSTTLINGLPCWNAAQSIHPMHQEAAHKPLCTEAGAVGSSQRKEKNQSRADHQAENKKRKQALTKVN
ncbi:unnamed protein product [Gadus morhua 'NCC']